jgi:hypothetical protein
MGERIYERPFEIKITNDLLPARASAAPLGVTSRAAARL